MSLLAYYKMNTGWTDSSGNGYDGTNNGAIINTVDQKLGAGCGSFDGLNDKITFASHYDPSGEAKFSIDGWINHDTGAINDCIFGWFDGTDGLFIQSRTAGEGLLVFAGTGNDFAQVSVDISTDWVYFTMVYDGSLTGNTNRLKLYYNSVEQVLGFQAGAAIPNVLPSIGGTPELGALVGVGRYWDGLIDDIAVYNHALTQDEIDYRWNGGAGREISVAGNVIFRRRMEGY